MEELIKLRSERSLTIGVLLFDGYELLDVYGPLELFFATAESVSGNSLKLVYISTGSDLIVTATGGPQVKTQYKLLEDKLPSIDILFIPGGIGTRPLQKDEGVIGGITNLAEHATLVFTVCTGSMLLASTGLLNGVRATTNKIAFNLTSSTYPQVNWVPKARWVCDGKFYTSSGVSAGMDLAFHFILQLFGSAIAEQAATAAEYTTHKDADYDPFSYLIDEADRKEKHVKLAKKGAKGVLRIAVVIYENFEMLDTFGPLEMFKMANKILEQDNGKGVSMELIGERPLLKSAGGPYFVAKTFDNVDASSYDLMLLPGGIGTIREVYNPNMKKFLISLASKCSSVMTVCTGATLLASTGLLDNRKATCNKLAFDLLAQYGPNVNWIEKARWVQDQKFYTSSGVSAGIDLSLYVLEQLFSEEFAKEAAIMAEYEWNSDPNDDPFVTSISKPSLFRKVNIRVQKLLLDTIFVTGFKLGAKMNGITSLLLKSKL